MNVSAGCKSVIRSDDIMRLTWGLYRALARTVFSVRDLSVLDTYHVDMSTPTARLFLIEEIMEGHPRHWGRFATYVVWLTHHYPPERTYAYYLEMLQYVPDLIPSLPSFALRCLLNKLCKMTTNTWSPSV